MTTIEEKEALLAELAKHNIHPYDASKKLYKYVNVDTAKLIFGNGSLKFSTPVELNDNDFELALLSKPPIQQQKKIIEFYYRKSKPNATANDVTNYFKSGEGKRLMLNGFCQRMIKNSYGKLRDTYKIFCATTKPDNAEMWNNPKYGDGGKGFCIEYQMPLICAEYHTLKVFYDKDFKPFGTYDKAGLLNEVSIQRWYFTKKIRYKDEDEVRIFSDKFCDYFKGIVPFPKKIFTGLYYGQHTSDIDIAALELLLRRGGYSFEKGIRANY